MLTFVESWRWIYWCSLKGPAHILTHSQAFTLGSCRGMVTWGVSEAKRGLNDVCGFRARGGRRLPYSLRGVLLLCKNFPNLEVTETSALQRACRLVGGCLASEEEHQLTVQGVGEPIHRHSLSRDERLTQALLSRVWRTA